MEQIQFHKAQKQSTSRNERYQLSWRSSTQTQKTGWESICQPCGLILICNQSWKIKTMVLSNKNELYSDSVIENERLCRLVVYVIITITAFSFCKISLLALYFCYW
jgi:hypothetical protein